MASSNELVDSSNGLVDSPNELADSSTRLLASFTRFVASSTGLSYCHSLTYISRLEGLEGEGYCRNRLQTREIMSILLGYIKNKKGFWPEKHTHNVAEVLQKKKGIFSLLLRRLKDDEHNR